MYKSKEKISLIALSMVLSFTSLPVNAQSRNRTRSANTQRQASRTISGGLISGYNDKIFKNPTITVIEKRSIDLASLMKEGSEGIGIITKTKDSSGNVYDTYYKLCLPCSDIFLEAEFADGTFKSYTGGNAEPGNCYSLEPDARYTIATKEGATSACGTKLRMTINDMRSSAQTERDSVILNVLPNSSAFDYTNIEMGQDTDMEELMVNYNKFKNEAREACTGKSIADKLNYIRGLLIGTVATAGTATATGLADTTLQSVSKAKDTMNENTEETDVASNVAAEDTATTEEVVNVEESEDTTSSTSTTDTERDEEERRKLTGSEIASITLSSVSGGANVASSVTGIMVATSIDELIEEINKCKNAASKMNDAGIALENALQDMMVTDTSTSSDSTGTN